MRTTRSSPTVTGTHARVASGNSAGVPRAMSSARSGSSTSGVISPSAIRSTTRRRGAARTRTSPPACRRFRRTMARRPAAVDGNRHSRRRRDSNARQRAGRSVRSVRRLHACGGLPYIGPAPPLPAPSVCARVWRQRHDVRLFASRLLLDWYLGKQTADHDLFASAACGFRPRPSCRRPPCARLRWCIR